MPLPDTTAEPSIDSILQVIARGADLPDAAMRACAVRITEALPTLLGLLDRAGSHGLRREPDRTLVFRAVHILAEARVTAVCRPILRLLRRPIEEVDDLLGDALTETLPRIVISVFDGDAPALFAAIADRRIDESARWSLLTAAAFLTWDGRIDTKATHDFLRGFGTGRLAPADDVAWIGWGEAIAVLGFTDLAPMVEAVWATMAPEIADLPYFRETLSDAGAEPRDAGRFTANNAGYLDDSVAALDWTRRRVEPAVRDAPRPKPPLATVRAPGRNEACPCGSGRKYKKCCGASA